MIQRTPVKFVLFSLLLAWMLIQPEAAMAHNSSFGYSNVTLTATGMRYELLLLPDEIQPILSLDHDQDGTVTIEEANQKESELLAFVARWMSVKAENSELPPKFASMEMTERGVGLQMIKLNLNYEFGKTVNEVVIKYDILVTTASPEHRNFANIISIDGSTKEFVFDKDHQILKLGMNPSRGWIFDVWAYISFGMEHLFTGYDHLLFLLGLVIVRLKWREYLKIVTAFTVGHSITLALAATGMVSIPGSIIEPLIALSIVFVAAENLLRKQHKWRWLITAFFGLIHGFGFAGVLEGRFTGHIALPLFSFNLGIEIGQLIVLAVLLPIIHTIGLTRWRTQTLYALSGMIGLFGIYWFIERVV
ncbi:hypothetical protein GC096_35770 [Paenibacillus sp. LMG 31461]|uniref:HupE/UreJ family protein n=1 Tax=Paenibacillus plantarum TaxID=2654975 RepID=A0ABX1XNI3_9BACL|nr:HupE/UreJ family protein [Paenibacillus plantarum]NOU69379.1 hypothetical protein [Paenibacillus plantarum]